MQTKDLVKLWNAPDNTKLTPKQMSIRLPLHVAAKVSALCEMFPRKTKTEIIGDLLATALDDVAEGLSSEPYFEEEDEARGAHPEEWWGDRRRYDDLVKKYLQQLEIENKAEEESEDTEATPAQKASSNRTPAESPRKRAATGTGARSRRK